MKIKLFTKHIITVSSIATFLWVLYLAIHTLLRDKWALWNITFFIPPITYFLCTITLVILVSIKKNITAIIFIIFSLPFVWFNSDFNFPRLSKETNIQNTITIFNWNTANWDIAKNDDFFHFLQDQNADVYQLQEFSTSELNKIFYYSNKLKEYFPNYFIGQRGEFTVLSKFPITNVSIDDTKQFTKTDIWINGSTVTFYNVHIRIPLQPLAVNLADMQYRFTIRKKAFDEIVYDIKNSPNPVYISGDFNTTKSMGNIQKLLKYTHDSFTVSNVISPATWKFFGVRLWRIDYNLATKDISLISHETINPQRYSDHWAQKVIVKLDQQ